MTRMQKIVFGLFLALLFYISFILFLPKEALWYQAERFMKKAEIVMDQEELHDRYIDLALRDGTLYIQGFEVARIGQITISPWLIANRVKMERLFIGNDLKMLKGMSVTSVSLSHSLLTATHVTIAAQGNFGTLEGDLDLFEGQIELLIKPSPLLKSKAFLMRQLRKDKEGYRFVRKF